MKKIVAISISLIVLFIGIYSAVIDTKQFVFNFDNGVKVTTIMEYNKFNGILTCTVRVKNRWLENGFLEFFNPVLITVSGLTENDKNIFDVNFRYRTFTYKDNYYESYSMTDKLQYKHFKEIKKAEARTLMENW